MRGDKYISTRCSLTPTLSPNCLGEREVKIRIEKNTEGDTYDPNLSRGMRLPSTPDLDVDRRAEAISVALRHPLNKNIRLAGDRIPTHLAKGPLAKGSPSASAAFLRRLKI